MKTTISNKRELDPSIKQNFMILGKSFQTLNITRWIYIFFTGLFIIPSYFRQIFLGPFIMWFSSDSDSSNSVFLNMPVGLLIFGFIALAVPRIIGNLNLIIKLNKTSKYVRDCSLENSAKYQKIRVFFYSLMVFLLILMISHILQTLDLYYKSLGILASIDQVLQDITHYNQVVGFDFKVVFLMVVFILCSLAEKIVNFLSWKEFDDWINLQIEKAGEDASNRILLNMDLGFKLLKYGILIMLVESTVGNIIFNIGMSKVSKGLKNYPVDAIYVFHPSENRRVVPRPVYRYTRVKNSNAVSRPTSNQTTLQYQVTSQTPLFCGYCGTKVIYKGAKYCGYCGNPLY